MVAEQQKVYPDFTENSKVVLARRYQSKNEKGEIIETADEVFRRVANNIAEAEWQYLSEIRAKNEGKAFVKAIADEFFDMMRSFDCVPNSPTLMNAGRRLQMLSACFVLPIEDDMDSIFTGIRNTAMVHKSGGGTGFSFSKLRPKGDIVGSTGGIASGPVSFLEAYDKATDVVKQGGTRRGANMAIMRFDHPDILDFIHCKEDGKSISNFNISVAVTEDWMYKVVKGEDYNLIHPKTGEVTGTLNAREVFYNHICPMAWKTGDPGLWFVDRVNRTNPNSHIGQIESCNPCGEQELMSWESCNLASINLFNHVDEETESFDWRKLKTTVWRTVRFLDNVIDMNKYPLPEIDEMSKHTRRIGLGVMGWADSLIKLRIKYDSNDALKLAEQVMEFIQHQAHTASEDLAQERGCYPGWEGSHYQTLGIKMRNSSPVTIAPTGTISIIAGASSGIEPLFALSYVRNVMDKDKLTEVYEPLRKESLERGFYSDEMFKELANVGSFSTLPSSFKDQLPEDVYEVYRTSYDVPFEWHIKMQAAFQRYTDNAVSKTINMPEDATEDMIAGAYMMAFKLNCKGITVYRDGSKDEQVLSFGKNGSNGHRAEMQAIMSTMPKRPRELEGKTIKISAGQHGNLYITLNHIHGMMVEVLASIGKAGGCEGAQMEAITRLVSLALRDGIRAERVIEQLKGITCCPSWDNGRQIRSGPDAVALAMEDFLKIHVSAQDEKSGRRCPDCSSAVIYQEGCVSCTDLTCGWSKCD